MNTKNAPILRDVRRRFDRAASSFDSVDFVHAVTRDGLFARLEPLVLNAQNILDLGCATGGAAKKLRQRFGRPHIVSLDISGSMLRQSLRKQSWRTRVTGRRASLVQADASFLPFQDASFDVVFSNQLLPFVDEVNTVFAEANRVLREGGVFAFATLGPDSFMEIRRAWSAVDQCAHVNHFPDMHDIGDAAVRSGLRDPVLDVDRLTVSYKDYRKLFADLTSAGARNALRERNKSLVGRDRFERVVAALQGDTNNPTIELDLELVYGHCWGGGVRQEPSNYRIAPTDIPRRRK